MKAFPLTLRATVLLVFIPVLAFAQLLTPITWSFSQKKVNERTAELRFTATIERGWHLYDMDLPAGGPVSTQFVFENTTGAKLIGKTTSLNAPIQEFDKQFELNLRWYVDKAVFVQRVDIIDPNKALVTGEVVFMGCNNEQCLSPTRIPFEFNKFGTKSQTSKTTDSPQSSSIDNSKSTTNSNSKSSTTVNQKSAVAAANQSDGTIAVEPLGIDSVQRTNDTTPDLWQPVVDQLKALGGQQTDQTSSWLLLFLAGFIGGLLALLTPCVWPIIPLTVSFFLKRNHQRSKAVSQALVYGLSIVVIYLILGMGITALFGASALNSLATSALFNVLFFILLLVFGVSFLGAFELVLPASWTNKMDQQADRTSGWLSLFFMAFTLVLVSFSCTGPIIGTLLVQAATMNSLMGPAIGMFGFSLALAIPFALFALFPTWLKRLPKSGGWLNSVKVVLGFLELAFALKFLSVADLAYGWGILDRETFLALWIVLFLLLGFYFLGWIRLPHDEKRDHVTVPRLFLALITLSFTIYMVPGLWGAPLKAISAFTPPASTQDFNLYENEVTANFTAYEAGMEAAKLQQKPVLIDFSGYGCVNCRKMENAVWQDPAVKQLLEQEFVLITLMVDDKTPLSKPYTIDENGIKRNIKTIGDHWSYLQRVKFGSNAQPFYVILDHKGNPLAPSRAYNEDIDGYVNFLKGGIKAFEGLRE